MKGKLHKTGKRWVVEYMVDERTPIGHKSWWETLPLHPDYVKYYFLDEDAEGGEVEFEIVKEYIDSHTNQVQKYAKLIKPKTGGKVDLQKLEDKFDKLLSEETPESFHKWLESKRGPIRNYHSPKIDEMLKELQEDDIKDWAHLTSVSKGLDGSVYQSTYEDGFIDGYNKAKETLYKEGQVREVIRNCFKSNADGFVVTEDDMMRTIKNSKKDIL